MNAIVTKSTGIDTVTGSAKSSATASSSATNTKGIVQAVRNAIGASARSRSRGGDLPPEFGFPIPESRTASASRNFRPTGFWVNMSSSR